MGSAVVVVDTDDRDTGAGGEGTSEHRSRVVNP